MTIPQRHPPRTRRTNLAENKNMKGGIPPSVNHGDSPHFHKSTIWKWSVAAAEQCRLACTGNQTSETRCRCGGGGRQRSMPVVELLVPMLTSRLNLCLFVWHANAAISSSLCRTGLVLRIVSVSWPHRTEKLMDRQGYYTGADRGSESVWLM